MKPDLLILSDPQHLVYFANYAHSPFVFRGNDAGAILLARGPDQSVLIGDNLLASYLEKAAVDEIHAPVWYRGVESAPRRESWLIHNTLTRMQLMLPPGETARIGIEASQVPAGLTEALRQRHPKVSFIDLDPFITRMKRAKDADEIDLIRRSVAAGEAGMAAGRVGIVPGMTEFEIYHLVARAAQLSAGGQAIVYGDFVTGPRCEVGGGPPTDRKIKAGELVLLDFSTVIHQYRADFADTFVCYGEPSARIKDLAAACLEALAVAENLLKPGTPGQEIDRAIRDSFATRHLAETFTTHSGHGIGLGHPEAPFLTPKSSDTLEAGDVVAVEPGQYHKGLAGMRFERNYLMTPNGFELLSKHPLFSGPTAGNATTLPAAS